MPNHTQTTPEELEKQVADAAAALEAPAEEVVTKPEADDATEEEVMAEEAVVVEPVTEPVTAEEVVTEPTAEELLKKTSNEARKLAEDKKIVNEAFHEARNLPEPTTDELQAAYPAWDTLSETEQQLAKDVLINKRRFETLEKAEQGRAVVEEWNNKVTDYIENPQTLVHNPALEGKQEKFLAYAKQKENRNVNLNLIVKSFLYDAQQDKVVHKGKMFETGTGGDKVKAAPVDDKLSVEESEKLRSTDYNKWKSLLLAGKIPTS